MRRGAALGATIALSLGTAAGALLSRTAAAPAAASVDGGTTIRELPPELLRRPVRVAAASRSEPRRRRLTEPCGARGARVVRWRVAVDPGVDLGARAFARQVRAILCDRRGWTSAGGVGFRYDPRAPRLVALRTSAATERRCLQLTGLRVFGFSCAGAREAVLNAERWFEGSPTLRLSVARYRALMVNHEVGHLLGLGHRGCPAAGAGAPVMMQQSKGLAGCRANPWPLAAEVRAAG